MLSSRERFADMMKIPRPPQTLRNLMDVVVALVDAAGARRRPWEGRHCSTRVERRATVYVFFRFERTI